MIVTVAPDDEYKIVWNSPLSCAGNVCRIEVQKRIVIDIDAVPDASNVKVSLDTCDVFYINEPCAISASLNKPFGVADVFATFDLPSNKVIDTTPTRIYSVKIPAGELSGSVSLVYNEGILRNPLKYVSLKFRALGNFDLTFQIEGQSEFTIPVMGRECKSGETLSVHTYKNMYDDGAMELLCIFLNTNAGDMEGLYEMVMIDSSFEGPDSHGSRVLSRISPAISDLAIAEPTTKTHGGFGNLADRFVKETVTQDVIVSLSFARPLTISEFCTPEGIIRAAGKGVYVVAGGNERDKAARAFSTNCPNVQYPAEVIPDNTTKTGVIIVNEAYHGGKHSRTSPCGPNYGSNEMCIALEHDGGSSNAAPRLAFYLQIISHIFGVSIESAWDGVKACTRKGNQKNGFNIVESDVGVGILDLSCFTEDLVLSGTIEEYSTATGIAIDDIETESAI